MVAYVCSKCGRSHSKEEYEENRFCRQCGQILVHQNVKTINTEKNSMTEHGSMGSEEDFMQLFPYVPYPQQSTFMQDATKILSQGGVFVVKPATDSEKLFVYCQVVCHWVERSYMPREPTNR